MSDELLLSMAEDIQTHCNWCSCYEEDTDEYGNAVITNICPFLDKSEDPTIATCVLGDPSMWDL